MPYEPTFPHPYLEAIDVESKDGVNFQCVINPKDKITAYEITILSVEDNKELCRVYASIVGVNQIKSYKFPNTAAQTINTNIYDSPLPFSGKSNSDESIFIVNIPKEVGLKNGNEYFWNIKLSTAPNVDVISKDFYFTTSTTPNINISIPNTVLSNKIELVANYSQNENILPAYYNFILYNNNKNIYSTNDMFSSDITFSYNKLISGEQYFLELTVVLDNGMEIYQTYSFNVKYDKSDFFITSVIESNNKETSVLLDYSQQVGAGGVLEGDNYSIFSRSFNNNESPPENVNTLWLTDSQSIYWNKAGDKYLDMDDSNIIFHWHGRSGFSGKIFELIDDIDESKNIVLSFENGSFCFTNGAQPTQYYSLNGDDISDCWYVISLTPSGIEYIKDSNIINYSFLTIDSVPYVAESSFIYTGESFAPTWIGYDPNQLLMSGVTESSEIGEHEVIFTPINGYIWWDGTFAPKTVKWKIKTPGFSLGAWSWQAISAITKAGQAQNYFKIGDKKTIHLEGNVGEYPGGNDYFINDDFVVYIIGFNHNGSENTIDFGTFKVKINGFLRDCALHTGSQANVSYSSTNGIRIYNMNHYGQGCAGGWEKSDMRYDILGSTDSKGQNASATTALNPVPNTLMAALPSDLRTVMRPMYIYTDNVGNQTDDANNVTMTVDFLPLMSPYECLGFVSNSDITYNKNEHGYQKQYEYFTTLNGYASKEEKLVKQAHWTASGYKSEVTWWLRSPAFSKTNPSFIADHFTVIDTRGKIGWQDAHYMYGVAPIFRI